MDNHSTNLYLIVVFRNDINHEIKTQKPFQFGKAFAPCNLDLSLNNLT